MTTSVDIIFKELPALNQADDRLSRVEPSSSGSDYGRDDAYISRNKDEKSFDDYLEDYDVSDDNPIKQDKYKQDVTSDDQPERKIDTYQTNTDDQQVSSNDKNRAKEKITSDNNDSEQPIKVDQTDNVQEDIAQTSVNIQNTPDEKTPSYSTKDLLLTETTAEKTALQNNSNSAQTEVKTTTTTIADQIVISKPSSENTPDQSFDQNSEQNNSSQNNVKNANAQNSNNEFKIASEINTENVKKEISEKPDVPLTQTVQNITNQTSTTLNNEIGSKATDGLTLVLGQNVKADSNDTNKAVSQPNEIQTALNPALADTNNEILPGSNPKQKVKQSTQISPALPIKEQNISDDIGAAISSIANNANQEISNADLMQKPAPKPDTVTIESNKTLPFAVIQSPNNVLRAANTANKKSDATNSVNNGTTKQASANNSIQSATQNNISQAMLHNAQKSDIQIDLGFNAQKFDASLGQSMTPNGQTTLSTGSMLASQDVNFQKTLSAMSTSKLDTPMNVKMINEQITVAINKNIVKGLNNFSIRLHPAELGQVDIKLEFAADGKMHAAMIVENEKTLTLLQRDQAALEKALQDAGVNLSNKEMNFSLMKQNQENNTNKFAGGTGSAKIDNETEELTDLGTMQNIRMSYSNQALDISV